ncbi:hypothetical protein NFI96_028647, partial [Prochilodus magdalenae]
LLNVLENASLCLNVSVPERQVCSSFGPGTLVALLQSLPSQSHSFQLSESPVMLREPVVPCYSPQIAARVLYRRICSTPSLPGTKPKLNCGVFTGGTASTELYIFTRSSGEAS